MIAEVKLWTTCLELSGFRKLRGAFSNEPFVIYPVHERLLSMLPYLTIPAPNDKVWIGAISIFMCFTTYLYGQMIFPFLQLIKPKRFFVFQRFNLVITSLFACSVLIDAFPSFDTHIMMKEIVSEQNSKHLRLCLFSPLGEAYLGLVNMAFLLFTFLLVREYVSTRSRANLGVIFGVIIYFITIANDCSLLI